MEFLNKIEIQGIVGNASSSKVGESEVVRFSVVTEYCYKDRNGGAVIDATWFNVTAWRRSDGENKRVVDFSQLGKGVKVNVKGRIRTSRYTDSNGIDRTVWEVVASDVNVIND